MTSGGLPFVPEQRERVDVEAVRADQLAAHAKAISLSPRKVTVEKIREDYAEMGCVNYPDDANVVLLAALAVAEQRAERMHFLACQILAVHDHVVMDTEADRELHDRAIATFRAALSDPDTQGGTE